MKKIKKPKKKKTLASIFFKVFLTIVIIYGVAFAGFVALTFMGGEEGSDYLSTVQNIFPDVINANVPDRTNVLLLGVDADETRTDTIMVASYNSVSKEVSLLSIPRDTLVTVSAVNWDVMLQNEPALAGNRSREIKINSVHAHAGKENGVKFLEEQIEEMLDIKIDYYAKVNCEAFRYLVDSIGGIQFNVEQRLQYSDPTQDLYIDLYPGMQTLDGDKAEQLVRFRYGYATQDLHRVEVQREFMKVFLGTALSKDTIMSNPTAYLKTLIDYVDTDMGVTTSVKYVNSLSGFSSENVKGYTLPGNCKNINGGSYYIMDDNETADLVYDIFKKDPHATEGTTDDTAGGSVASTDKSIQVLNGGYTSGMASYIQEKLQKEGFTVNDIGDYKNGKIDTTKIYVKEDGLGEDLKKYFSNPEIIVNSEKTDNYDIVIVIGSQEKKNG